VNISAEQAFASSPVLYRDSVQITTYLYDATKPQLVPGKRYAWRVQAKAKNGAQVLAMFRNNGISEAYWFTYQNNCAAPLGITATVQGTRVTIEWQNNPAHLEWKVEYREKNNPTAEWFSLTNTLPRIMLTDLKGGTQYEYRVGGSCQAGAFTYSALNSFTTAGTPVPPVANCGDSTLPANGSGATLQTLIPGDIIKAGSFDVTVGHSSGSGSFTGMGYVVVPWLMNAKVEVRFTNITLSLDKKLLTGIIETTYDPNESGIDDLDEYVDLFTAGYGVGGVLTGELTADTTLNITIQWPGGITVNPIPPAAGPYNINITPQGGGAPIVIAADKLPKTIMDASGTVYQVDANGQVKQIAKAGGADLLKTTNKKLIDGDKGLVRFMGHAQEKYAFDEWQPVYKKSNTFNKEYEKIACVNGGLSIDNGSYYVSAKAIAPGETEKIYVVLRKANGSTLNKDSIQFVNGKGSIYPTQPVAGNDSTVMIEVVGGPAKDAQEIYALYKVAGGKALNLGKLLVASYPRKEYKVKLVPVKGKGDNINPIQMEERLNKIYGKLNVNFKVTKVNSFENNQWDLDRDSCLKTDASNVVSSYTNEMKRLNDDYRLDNNISSDEICLMLMGKSKSPNNMTIYGQMPRGRQIGYLFTEMSGGDFYETAAHEIGHGAFALKHLFDYAGVQTGMITPVNLMDYGSGEQLIKFQWDLIGDPAVVLGIGESVKGTRDVAGEVPMHFNDDVNFGHFNFLTPNGEVIPIPITSEKIYTSFGLSAFHEIMLKIVSGTLTSFTVIDEKEQKKTYELYLKSSGGNQVITYETNQGERYVPKVNNYDGSVILRLPLDATNYSLYKFIAPNLTVFTGESTIPLRDEINFPVQPFSSTNQVKRNPAFNNEEYVYTVASSTEDCQYCYASMSINKISDFIRKKEILLLTKIVNLQRMYRVYFDDFTNSYRWLKWDNASLQQQISIWQGGGSGTGGAGGTVTYCDCLGVWETKVKNSATLQDQWNSSDKTSFFKSFLDDLQAYITQKNVEKSNFINSGININLTVSDAFTKLLQFSDDEISRLEWSKRLILLKVLTRDCLSGSVEKELVRLVKFIPESDILRLLDALVTEEDADGNHVMIKDILHVGNIINQCDLNGKELLDFVSIMDGHARKVINVNHPKWPGLNKLNNRYFLFDPELFNNAPVWNIVKEDGNIQFRHRYQFTWATYDHVTVNPFMPVTVEFTGSKKIDVFQFKKGESVTTTAIMAYFLMQKANNANLKLMGFTIVNTALVATGIGSLATMINSGVYTGAAVTLATADVLIGSAGIIIDSYLREKWLGDPQKEKILAYWDAFNLLYGAGRITQALVDLASSAKPAIVQARQQATQQGDNTALAAIRETEESIDGVIARGVGGELVQQEAAWLSRLDNLNLSNLRNELDMADAVTRAKFIDEFAGASDDALRALDNNMSLFEYWKTTGTVLKQKNYPNVGHKSWDETKNLILSSGNASDIKILNAIDNLPPPNNNQVAMAGAYAPELGGEVVIKYNTKGFDISTLEPELKQHLDYLTLIKNDFDEGGNLYQKLYSNVPLQKIQNAGIAGTHAEVLAMNEVIKKLKDAGKFNSIQDLGKISVLVKGRGSFGNMCRCPHCFHLTDGARFIGNQ
jgi:hypothetical protein